MNAFANARGEATLAAKLNARGEAKRMNTFAEYMAKLRSGDFSDKVLSAKLAYPVERVKPEG